MRFGNNARYAVLLSTTSAANARGNYLLAPEVHFALKQPPNHSMVKNPELLSSIASLDIGSGSVCGGSFRTKNGPELKLKLRRSTGHCRMIKVSVGLRLGKSYATILVP